MAGGGGLQAGRSLSRMSNLVRNSGAGPYHAGAAVGRPVAFRCYLTGWMADMAGKDLIAGSGQVWHSGNLA